MAASETLTTTFLKQWHAGREEGLQALLEQHLPWLHERVRRRLSRELRAQGATCDYVQDAVVQFLTFAPKFTIAGEAEFRALLLRIATNALRNRYRWFTRKRRAIANERPIPPDTVLALDPPRADVTTPSEAAVQHEQEAWIRLGMELLDDGEREVLVLRDWEGLPFFEIGALLGITENAAWMRHRRAVEKLGDVIWCLRSGNIGRALETTSSARDRA